jgi:hypothetical protein
MARCLSLGPSCRNPSIVAGGHPSPEVRARTAFASSQAGQSKRRASPSRLLRPTASAGVRCRDRPQETAARARQATGDAAHRCRPRCRQRRRARCRRSVSHADAPRVAAHPIEPVGWTCRQAAANLTVVRDAVRGTAEQPAVDARVRNPKQNLQPSQTAPCPPDTPAAPGLRGEDPTRFACWPQPRPASDAESLAYHRDVRPCRECHAQSGRTPPTRRLKQTHCQPRRGPTTCIDEH